MGRRAKATVLRNVQHDLILTPVAGTSYYRPQETAADIDICRLNQSMLKVQSWRPLQHSLNICKML